MCNVQVEKLLKLGADVNMVDEASGLTPLAMACVQGHSLVALRLLEARPEQADGELNDLIKMAEGKKRLLTADGAQLMVAVTELVTTRLRYRTSPRWYAAGHGQWKWRGWCSGTCA